jgi:hypothetical protein
MLTKSARIGQFVAAADNAAAFGAPIATSAWLPIVAEASSLSMQGET